MNVLFDTNVLLDALLAREAFVEDAAFLLEAVETQMITGFISATTLTDVHYLVGRLTKSPESAITAVTQLLKLMDICPVDRQVLETAIALNLPDFEDAVQVACAMTMNLDVITTRDVKGFIGSPIAIIEPNALRLKVQENVDS